MSVPREWNHPKDFVILTVDVEDSPIAELPLTEIYNVEASTLNDDYLLVFQDIIKLQLESTYGLGDRLRCQDGIVCPALRMCHVAKQTKCNGST